MFVSNLFLLFYSRCIIDEDTSQKIYLVLLAKRKRRRGGGGRKRKKTLVVTARGNQPAHNYSLREKKKVKRIAPLWMLKRKRRRKMIIFL